MIEFKLYYDANKGIYLNNELRMKGYTQDIHYNFRYVPNSWDPITGQPIEPKHVIFEFYDEHESLATWFSLKYL